MADVELVIRIPEEIYNTLDLYGYAGARTYEEVINAIKNGTPLPKGHGRLIDADMVDKSVKDPYQNREVMYWVNNTKTIIEADLV